MTSKLTEKDPTLCVSYEKTGCCEKGELCNKIHRNLPMSRIVLFHHLYPDPLAFMESAQVEIPDLTPEMQQNLLNAFYLDVYEMMRTFGQVEDIIVCGNRSDHMNGNVLVAFREVDAAYRAQTFLNGEFYAGRKIRATFTPIYRASNSICHSPPPCIHGDSCSYVHPLHPSPYVYKECFPTSLKSFSAPFRHLKRRMIPDTPMDLLYGRTNMPK